LINNHKRKGEQIIMLPEQEANPTPDAVTNLNPEEEKPQETEVVSDPVPEAPAALPAFETSPAREVSAPALSDVYDSTALSLYIVTIFSGASMLCSASYLVWNALNYFTQPASDYSFFDLSSFTIYVILYLVLFTTLYVLASARLDKCVKQAGSLERPLRTVSAIWRALLVVWGVVALAGLLYSPLSAAADGDSSSIVTDVTSAVIGLVLIGLLFWRDLFVPKLRSGMVAVAVIAGLALVITGANAYASFNPKQPEEDPYDYSSSTYDY